MGKIHQSIAVLVLVLIGLMGCGYDPQAGGARKHASVTELQQNLRDLWVGHIFWVRHVASNNTADNQQMRDAAEKEVVANAKQIAHAMTPFYGEAASQKFLSLLDINYGAVRAYSEAPVAGHTRRQHAALARPESNADEIADFLSHLNPYLQKDIVRSLITTHGAHHVLQINQYKAKDYAPLGATWPMMRQHIYVIADTLTTALAKQFPSKFS